MDSNRTVTRKFMDDDFLLNSTVAKVLYHKHAKLMPIYDYHCHLEAKDIYEDRVFENLSQIWFVDDHYKWRALRACGVDEHFVTGNASDEDKYLEWAKVLPKLIANPLYHWSHLELKRYFDVDDCLNPMNAKEIWEKCQHHILTEKLSPRKLIRQSNVKMVVTTDDPLDDLSYHKLLREEEDAFEVRPTFRADPLIHIEKPEFGAYITALGTKTGSDIHDLDGLMSAVEIRLDYFSELGCNMADHGMDEVVYGPLNLEMTNETLVKKLSGDRLTEDEITAYKSYFQFRLGCAYAARDWVMQVHIGALRDANKPMVNQIGQSKGYDCINDKSYATELARMLSDLEQVGKLPKTVLYNLNPRDNYMLATLSGSFNETGIKGKVQFGSGWWFCDQKDGMLMQLTALASLGVLSNFVGMLTDSRSYLSYTRHEYFRRILCDFLGDLVTRGEYPEDMLMLGSIVEHICYNNAVTYFK